MGSSEAWNWQEAYSSDGKSYTVYRLPVPRIHNYIQNCVIYLYPSEDHAIQGERVGGSGFLVHVPIESDASRVVTFAVTNRHVYTKAPVVRVNMKDGRLAIADFPKEYWIPHPNGDDIAIVPVDLDSDVHQISSIGIDLLLNKAVMDKYDIGIGDEVFVVGRFINHEGKQRNNPSLRFGTIAQMPDGIMQDTGFEQESFLVEAKSIGGYSGSPVFVHMLPFSSRPTKDDPKTLTTVPLPGIGPWLLGIDWGHITDREPVLDSGVPVSQNWYVRSNTGMMGVVPAWKLAEMFKMNEVKEILKQADDASRRQKDGAAGVTDLAGVIPDINRDNILRVLLETPPEPRTKATAKTKRS